MDQLLDLNNFPILNASNTEEKVIKSIRLLSIFRRGTSVIFATNEDIVYGFGDNQNGMLGLGKWSTETSEPQINKMLSYKKLVDIAVGYQHCMGLTASGHVFGWGQNNFGELGVSSGTGFTGSSTPMLVRELVGIEVVQICCGTFYSLALTSYGQVYAWGRNSYHQLGLDSTSNVCLPRRLTFNERISSLSCGRIHAMAVSKTGRLYVWGVMKVFNAIIEANPDSDPAKPPAPLQNFDDIIVKKAVCGPNYSLILTTDGLIYAYGNNFDGQIGKGSISRLQHKPTRVATNTKFKDVIASKEDTLSVGVAVNDEYFVWGYVDDIKVFSPKRVNDPSIRSVFDIYAKFSRSTSTFQTVVINKEINFKTDLNLFGNTTQDVNESLNQSSNDLNENISQSKFSPKNDIIIEKKFDSNDERIVKSITEKSPQTTVTKSWSQLSIATNHHSIIAQTSHSFSEKIFLNFLIDSFNNEEKCDLKFIFGNKTIYCHKSFLRFRSQPFWQNCKNQFKNGTRDQIRVKPHLYDSFFQFIQHLYGQTPEINEENCSLLMKMAAIYKEQELQELCEHFPNDTRIILSNVCSHYERAVETKTTPQINGENCSDSMKMAVECKEQELGQLCLQFFNARIDISNVCPLYERAVKTKSFDLKDSCIEFAAQNKKQVMTSKAFLSMDGLLSMQLLHAINKL